MIHSSEGMGSVTVCACKNYQMLSFYSYFWHSQKLISMKWTYRATKIRFIPKLCNRFVFVSFQNGAWLLVVHDIWTLDFAEEAEALRSGFTINLKIVCRTIAKEIMWNVVGKITSQMRKTCLQMKVRSKWPLIFWLLSLQFSVSLCWVPVFLSTW